MKNRILPKLAVTLSSALLATSTITSAALADQKPFRIAGVGILVSDPYFVSVKCGAIDEAKALGVTLDWNGSTDAEVAAQRQIFDAMSLKDPDAYVFTPFNQTAFISPVKAAMSKGKPVVLADATMAEPVFYQGFHSDNDDAMKQIAGYLAENFKQKGSVALIAFGPANPIDEARYTEMPGLLKTAAPHLTLLQPQYAQGSASAAARAMSGVIQANPDLVAVYATNGPQAEGAASAIRAAHLEGKVKIIAYAASPTEIQGLKAGKFDALLAQSPYLIGKRSVEAAVKYLSENPGGKPVMPNPAAYSTTPIKLITKENVDEPSTQDFVFKSC